MKFKKFLATTLAIAAVLSAFVVPSSAAAYGPPPKKFQYIGTEKVVRTYLGGFLKVTVVIGDVDDDGKITLLDATLIKRYLLHRATDPSTAFRIGKVSYAPGDYMYMMDTDGDGDIDLLDATLLQQYLLWRETN